MALSLGLGADMRLNSATISATLNCRTIYETSNNYII